MTKTCELRRALRALNVYYSDLDGETFVDFRDTKKAQEAQIAAEAKRLGLRIDVADKGVIFSKF